MKRASFLLILFLLILVQGFSAEATEYPSDFETVMAEYNFNYVLNLVEPYTKVYFTKPAPYENEEITDESIPLPSVDSDSYETTIFYNMVLESNENGSYYLEVKTTHFISSDGLQNIPFTMIIEPEGGNESIYVASNSNKDVFTPIDANSPMVVKTEGEIQKKKYGVSYKFESNPDYAFPGKYSSTVTIQWSSV